MLRSNDKYIDDLIENDIRNRRIVNAILIICIILLVIIFTAIYLYAAEAGKIIDGDTFWCNDNGSKFKIRLYGIDCPEKKQPYGDEAKSFTYNFLNGKNFQYSVKNIDRYSRYVAIVYVDGICLNSELLRNGLAYVYNRYCNISLCHDWINIEHNAMNNMYGVWSKPDLITPWSYRHAK